MVYQPATSTSTVVAKEILTATGNDPRRFPYILYLLLSPIVVYADNLTNNQGTKLDREVIATLTHSFNWQQTIQNSNYEHITRLQNNYGKLSFDNDRALHKNIDIISNKDRLFRVALIRIPSTLEVICVQFKCFDHSGVVCVYESMVIRLLDTNSFIIVFVSLPIE